jgi:type I restriction enzyme S subunit
MSKPHRAAAPLARHSRDRTNPAASIDEPGSPSLPDDWTIKPFAELAVYQTGRTPARATARYWSTEEHAQPWVSIADMQPHGLVTKTAERISRDAVNEAFRGRVSRAGTLLMSFKLTIGRVATLGVDACHNEAIISIYPKAGLNQKYLEFFLAQVDYTDYQDRAVKGHTLNQEKIDRIAITLPPEPEQQKIAAVLWKLQRAIATQDRLLKATTDLKQSAMQRLFTRGLRGEPLKDTVIGPMPESWELAAISSLGQIITGSTPKTAVREYYESGDFHFIAPGDISDATEIAETVKKITDAGMRVSRQLPAGSTCVVCIGSSIGKVGITTQEHSTTNQQINAVIPSDEYEPRYVCYLLQFFSGLIAGRAAPSPVPILSKSQFSAIELPVTKDTDDQLGIVAALATLDQKIAHHRVKRAALNALFQTLLHKLMTAEIRVADLDIDTSEVAADRVPDSGKMVGGQAGPVNADHFVDVNKMIEKPERSRR